MPFDNATPLLPAGGVLSDEYSEDADEAADDNDNYDANTPLLPQVDLSMSGAQIARTAVSGAVSALATAFPPAGIASKALAVGFAVYDTKHALTTIADLNEFLKTTAGLDTDVRACTLYAIKKLNGRLKRIGAGILPYGSTAVTLFDLGQALQKKLLGRKDKRIAYATHLWEQHEQGDEHCSAVAEILLGKAEFARQQGKKGGYKLLMKAMSAKPG